MSLPPPFPLRRDSPLLLFAMVLLVAALIICATYRLVSETSGSTAASVALGLIGAGVALGALACGVGLLVRRRRGCWGPLLICVGSIGVEIYLGSALRSPLAKVVAEVQSVGAPHGLAIAQQPIQQAAATPGAAQVRASLVQWGEEAMVRPYEEHGPHGAWDDAARRLIRGSVLHLTGQPGAPGTEALRAAGREARQAGCADPWILFLLHRLANEEPDYLEVMEQAGAEMERAGYGSVPLFLARTQALAAVQEEDPDRARRELPACLESLRGALPAQPFRAGDYEAWTELFVLESVNSLLELDGEGVSRIVESVPGVEEWFRLRCRGRWEIIRAWQERSDAYANDVTSAQWSGFRAHLATARDLLERSWKAQPGQPATAKAMIKVELGTAGLAEMRGWFDRAVQARFDYVPAYESFRAGLLPRWFGSQEALLAFGRTCLATQRFDTAVPWQMMRAVQDVASEQEDAGAYYAREAPWEDLKAMLDGYLQHGDPARRPYYLSVMVVLAQRRGMDAEVARLLKELDYKIDPQVAADWNLPVEWIGRMVALSGPASNLTLAAARQESAHPQQAVETLLKAQAVPNLHPLAVRYLAHRLAEVRAVSALDAAPWQSLLPPADLAGWQATGGAWRVVSPGVLEVKTGPAGSRLTRLQPAGAAWELKGELQLVSRSPGRTEAAVFCGALAEKDPHSVGIRFWIKPHGSPGISLARGDGEAANSKRTDFDETFPFSIRLANGRLRISADGRTWFSDQPLPEGVVLDERALLGFGSTGGGESVVAFRNLEWRVAEPPPR